MSINKNTKIKKKIPTTKTYKNEINVRNKGLDSLPPLVIFFPLEMGFCVKSPLFHFFFLYMNISCPHLLQFNFHLNVKVFSFNGHVEI